MDLVVCPGCRTWTAERIDVRTLTRDGEVLACACGRRYPILDGVPLVVADPGPLLRGDVASVIERDLAPEVAALLAAPGPDDAPYARLLEHLSIYLDAQWGDRADPPVAGALGPVLDRLAALPAVGCAVELGCSTGRVVAALAARADHVVGLDLQLAAVRRARKLLDGEPVAYARRIVGRHYAPARIAIDRAVPADRRTLLCADALDPPLVPRAFDRVVALHVLDSVASPRQLLAVADALCAPGGELILSSPYAWQSSVMADDERLDGPDPAATLRRIVTGELSAPYRIEDDAELAWTLRRDARSTLTYQVHYLRARKQGT